MVGCSPGNEVLHVLQLAAQLYGPLQLVLQTLLEITGDTLQPEDNDKNVDLHTAFPKIPICLSLFGIFCLFCMIRSEDILFCTLHHHYIHGCLEMNTLGTAQKEREGNEGKSNYLQLFH